MSPRGSITHHRRPPSAPPTIYQATPGAAAAPLGRTYRRRQPEKTTLYQVIARELPAFAQAVRDQSDYGRGLPGFIEKEFLAYLDCGILANGFARVKCTDCRNEILVSFSCKGRGLCPSCTTRRMHDTAAHLVDRVLPRVPIRQWVLTFAPRVRWHLAADPRLASEALTLFIRALFNFQRKRARRLGIRLPRANASGAITFVQRFGSALQLAVHFHTLVPDGVFVPPPNGDPEARPKFMRLDPPTNQEVETVLKKIIRQILRLLECRGRIDAADIDPDDSRLATYAAASRSPVKTSPIADDDPPPLCARRDGFSLHAATSIHENDRVGLERLCRYGARPPLSLDRLSQLEDGNLQYRMKRTFSNGVQTIQFTPHEFLTRLCALIPPARVHLTRYHGIFAPRARRRAALTGRKSTPRTPRTVETPRTIQPPPESPTSQSPSLGDSPPDPNRPTRLHWSDLIRRVYEFDVLCCSACGGRLRVIAYITDPDTTKTILDHLGLPSTPPLRGPPRTKPPPRTPPRKSERAAAPITLPLFH